MNGVKITCLYIAGSVWMKGLGEEVEKRILDFINKKTIFPQNMEEIVGFLKKLDSYSEYCSLANLMRKDNPFNEDIVRIHWLGQGIFSLNGAMCFNHNIKTLKELEEMRIEKNLSVKIVNILLGCLVSYGKIIKHSEKKIKVLHYGLLYDSRRKYSWKREIRNLDIGFVKKSERGDLVSIHLNIAREKISPEQAETLKSITLQTLKILKIA